MLLILNVCPNSTKRSGLVYDLFTKSDDIWAVVFVQEEGLYHQMWVFPVSEEMRKFANYLFTSSE